MFQFLAAERKSSATVASGFSSHMFVRKVWLTEFILLFPISFVFSLTLGYLIILISFPAMSNVQEVLNSLHSQQSRTAVLNQNVVYYPYGNSGSKNVLESYTPSSPDETLTRV